MKRILILNAKGGCGKTTIATNLVTLFSARGLKAAIADADKQRSCLDWVTRREKSLKKGLYPDLKQIEALDWTKSDFIGDELGKGKNQPDIVVIDGPGGLGGEKAKKLVAEANHIVVPVLPSAFDWQASVSFLKDVSELKRVRKGKSEIHVVANRITRRGKEYQELEKHMRKAGFPILCTISDRVAYPRCAGEGTGIFDFSNAATRALRDQWTPLLHQLEE